MINTHVNVVEGKNPLKFLVHFKGNETNADVRFLRYIAFSMRRNTLLTRPRATCGTLLTSVYELLLFYENEHRYPIKKPPSGLAWRCF